MRIPRTKKTVAAAAIGTVALLGGGLSVANAATGGNGDGPAITGTVTAPAETTPEGRDTPASEKVQADQLAKLATVPPEAAKAAAEKAAGGTATDVQLGDENGFVVYEVTVKAPAGQVDVKVDAGSGAVLAQENDNEGSEGAKGSEGAGEQADGQQGPETADGPNDTGTSDGPDAPGSTDGQTGGGTTGGSTTAPTTPAP